MSDKLRKLKNLSDKQLVDRVNSLYSRGKNDDDEVGELFRRSKEKGFKVIPKWDTYEIEYAKGGKIKVGKRYGDWSVTQYEPITYDDLGSPNGGSIKLVNQETFDVITILNDKALRGAKWFTNSVKGLGISHKRLNVVIDKSIASFVSTNSKYPNYKAVTYAKGGKTDTEIENDIEFDNLSKFQNNLTELEDVSHNTFVDKAFDNDEKKENEFFEEVEEIGDNINEKKIRYQKQKLENYNKGKYAKGGKVPKQYDTMYGVGKTKYLVNFHDGKKTHKDGSPFFDMRTFSNKKDFQKFQKELEEKGYKYGRDYAKGGSVEDKEYVLERYYVYVHKDSYEEGETDNVQNWDSSDYGENNKTFSSKSALMDFIKEVIERDTQDDDIREDYFNIESDDDETTIDYAVLCKNNYIHRIDNYEKANEEEKEQWKKGDLELFSVGLTFKVKVYEPRNKAEFEKGGKVDKKGNEMVIGGLAGILLGIFLNK